MVVHWGVVKARATVRTGVVGVLVAVAVAVAVAACTVPASAGAWVLLDTPSKGLREPMSQYRQIDCGGPGSCLAVGFEQTFITQPRAAVWDGAVWRETGRLPDGAPAADSARLACASPTWCLLLGYGNSTSNVYAVWDGERWTTGTMTSLVNTSDLDCPEPGVCFATADVVYQGAGELFRWEGPNWVPVAGSEIVGQTSYSSARSLSCPTVDTCVLVSSRTAFRWHAGGWDTLDTADADPGLYEVECPAVDRCVMSGDGTVGGIRSAVLGMWSGGTVAFSRVPNPGLNLSGPLLSCAGPMFCLANSNKWTAVFDGTRWQAPVEPGLAGSNSLIATPVACATTVSCFGLPAPAVGAARVRHWTGVAWEDLGPPAGVTAEVNASLSLISCPTASSCIALGTYEDTAARHPLAESWDGERWTVLPDPPFESNDLTRLDCAEPVSCVAVYHVSGDAVLAGWDGTTWTRYRPNTSGNRGSAVRIEDVSCGGPASCLAVGYDTDYEPVILSWDGTTWATTAPPVAEPSFAGPSMSRVSCATPTYCMRVRTGDNGAYTALRSAQVWNGATWTKIAAPGAPPGLALGQLTDIDCPGPDTCVATGLAAQLLSASPARAFAASWNGRAWSSSQPFVTTPATPSVVTALPTGHELSCVSPTRCLAVELTATIIAPLPFAPEGSGPVIKLVWANSLLTSARTALRAPGDGWRPVVHAVSCAAEQCLAVGDATQNTTTKPVSYHYRFDP